MHICAILCVHSCRNIYDTDLIWFKNKNKREKKSAAVFDVRPYKGLM